MSDFDSKLVVLDSNGTPQELSVSERDDGIIVPNQTTMDYLLWLQLRGRAFTTCDFLDIGAVKVQILINPPPLETENPALVFYGIQGTKEGKVSYLKNATATAVNPIMLTNINAFSSNTPKSVLNTTSGVTIGTRIRHGRFGGGKNPGGITLNTGYIPKFGEKLVLEIESEEAGNGIAYEITIFELDGVISKT